MVSPLPQHFHYISDAGHWAVVQDDTSQLIGHSSLFSVLQYCWQNQKIFELHPRLLWFVIIHEMAEHIRQSGGRYNHLVHSHEPKTFEVKSTLMCRPTLESGQQQLLDQLEVEITSILGDELLNLADVSFSTDASIARVLSLLPFWAPCLPCPTVGKQCRHRDIVGGSLHTQLCGEIEDWQLLLKQVMAAEQLLCGLQFYFADVLSVVEQIVQGFFSPEASNAFCLQMYTPCIRDGDFRVNGWITAFFAHRTRSGAVGARTASEMHWIDLPGHYERGLIPSEVCSHITSASFECGRSGAKLPLTIFGGLLGGVGVNSAYYPGIGYAVAQTN